MIFLSNKHVLAIRTKTSTEIALREQPCIPKIDTRELFLPFYRFINRNFKGIVK